MKYLLSHKLLNKINFKCEKFGKKWNSQVRETVLYALVSECTIQLLILLSKFLELQDSGCNISHELDEYVTE